MIIGIALSLLFWVICQVTDRHGLLIHQNSAILGHQTAQIGIIWTRHSFGPPTTKKPHFRGVTTPPRKKGKMNRARSCRRADEIKKEKYFKVEVLTLESWAKTPPALGVPLWQNYCEKLTLRSGAPVDHSGVWDCDRPPGYSAFPNDPVIVGGRGR